MRKIAGIIIAVLCVGGIAQARTWTNTDGQTLDAEFVKVSDDQVYLKLARDGKVHPLKMDTLSAADQEYVMQREQEREAAQKVEKLAKRKARWLDDYDNVKEEAEKFDLPILMLYTAPEWCGPCRMLESNVLDSSEFREFAGKKLVLWIVDCSDANDKEDWLEENKAIAEKCRLEYFPMMYFLSKDMEKLGMIGGYESEWGPDKYIAEMEKIVH